MAGRLGRAVLPRGLETASYPGEADGGDELHRSPSSHGNLDLFGKAAPPGLPETQQFPYQLAPSSFRAQPSPGVFPSEPSLQKIHPLDHVINVFMLL